MKLTYAASIAKVEAELQAVACETAWRAPKAKTASLRILDPGTRNLPGVSRVAWGGGNRDTHRLGDLLHDVGRYWRARHPGILAPAESLVTMIESAASSLQSDL
jgi:hypothetical protein